MNILVVEDEELLANVLQHGLQKHGMYVVMFNNGEDAINLRANIY